VSIRIIVFTLVACLLFSFAAVAQEEETTLQGEITATDPYVDFNISLDAGTTIVLTTQAASPRLDTLLILFAPSGMMITANDDIDTRNGNTNASITYTVETNGSYRVRVRSFAGASTGSFTLIVQSSLENVVAVDVSEYAYADIPQSRTEDGAFVLGDPDAPITIIEFADWACPHCQDYKPTIDQIIEAYVVTGQANYEFRMFPTAGRELTLLAGQFAECAEMAQPGAFWQSYTLLYGYAEEGSYNNELGRALAQDLGLSYSDLLTCSADATQVQTDVGFGRESGVAGTPAIMVRYGEGEAEFITIFEQTYDRGAVPLDVLETVIANAQPE